MLGKVRKTHFRREDRQLSNKTINSWIKIELMMRTADLHLRIK
jgi:hypothetical protein